MQQSKGDAVYSFSYISKNEFESIFKHVRRERKKKHDEKAWERFLSKKQQKNTTKIDKEFVENCDDGSTELANVIVDVEPCKLCQKSVDEGPSIAPIGSTKKLEVCPPLTKSLKVVPAISPTSRQRLDSPERATELNDEKLPAIEDHSLFDRTTLDLEFKRVEEQREKIVSILMAIEKLLSQDPSRILDEEELSRNRIRAAEFAARFKRNYHYQLIRQLTEIQKINSTDSLKKVNHSTAMKKFKTGHQVVVQAFQAIEKHLRTNNEGPHNWLNEFLSSVCEMGELFGILFHCEDKEDQISFQNACSNVTHQLETLAIKQRKDPETRKKKKKHNGKKVEGKDNLWMYRNHRDWKSKASELTRLKQAKMNKKKKNEDSDCRDQIDGRHFNSVPDNLQDLKMEVKQREGALLRKHVRSVKEDQVRTMMEIVPDVTDSDHDDDKLEEDGLFHTLDDAVSKSAEYLQLEEKNENSSMVTQNKSAAVAEEVPLRKPRAITIPGPNLKNKNFQPTNVSYICITRPEDATAQDTPDFEAMRKWRQFNRIKAPVATQYRKALQLSQRKLKWYNTDVILFIDRVIDRIYEELMGSVAAEINIDHIILNLIEMEARR